MATTLDTEFLTYHLSGNDVHLRTGEGIVLLSKDKPELQQVGKSLTRGQPIKVSGEWILSKTLSAQVLDAESLEVK